MLTFKALHWLLQWEKCKSNNNHETLQSVLQKQSHKASYLIKVNRDIHRQAKSSFKIKKSVYSITLENTEGNIFMLSKLCALA